ncbi:MAG TPA: nicotinate-nicotinamide nucleotide adenylyltransferase, partial [Polyangiales bacterium]|nr:nicotinate-nicotinamide nucleotide adenylyltransferase [Polyangiales bacterium]
GGELVKPELAVFGGSFDPPHVGHVFLATYALCIAGVERVLAAPTFEHAFGKPLTAFEHRLAMCTSAFAALPAVEVSPIERELGGTSRTLRLLHELQRRFPGHQLRLLIGSDILAESARWQGFDEIRALAPPIVVTRGGHGDAGGPLFPQLSSTELRAQLAVGELDAQVLPWGVRAYIREHQLYA